MRKLLSENLALSAWRRKIYQLRICLRRQNFLSLDHPKTYKYMRRQWILIGQSILKTIRTIGDQKCPSRGSRNRTRTCAKSRPVTAGTVINRLIKCQINQKKWLNPEIKIFIIFGHVTGLGTVIVLLICTLQVKWTLGSNYFKLCKLFCLSFAYITD